MSGLFFVSMWFAALVLADRENRVIFANAVFAVLLLVSL